MITLGGYLNTVMVRKFVSVRDFKTVAVAEIHKEEKSPVFFLHYVSYEWVNRKLFICGGSRLDRSFAAEHFPNLEKYLRWQAKDTSGMTEKTLYEFLSDMSDIFGFDHPGSKR